MKNTHITVDETKPKDKIEQKKLSEPEGFNSHLADWHEYLSFGKYGTYLLFCNIPKNMSLN